MSNDDVEAARARFVATATGYWSAVRERDSRRATAQTEVGDRIVQEWAARGRAVELLGSLLTDSSPEVRYAAAAHLLHRGGAGVAVPVLEDLERNPTGLVAPTARLLLMQWRRQS